ncbi:MAG TPA: serine/threonine-protein kinase [Geothrix sp.]|jgi:tetratricopeptide (TPR) repeat protein
MATETVSPLQPGDVVGRYQVEAFVGEGGMGRVFRAWDVSLERHVALKVIRADHASQRAVLTRFQREAQILAKLDHAGICHVYDWLDHDGTLVMAMEWVDGTLLSTLLEGGPLPLPKAIRLLREVALALAAAHAKGVIHRDLKPSNIQITPEGSAKLLDFGLAKDFREVAFEDNRETWSTLPEEEATTRTRPAFREPLTRPGTVMGTRGFIAPELLLGESATAATDLYALGVIASLTLAGDPPPGKDGTPIPWTRRVLKWRSGSGPHPHGHAAGPHALRHLVDRLLSLDPAARPTAQEVVGALDQIQAPASPVWWAAGTAAITLAVAGLAIWAYGRGAIPEFSASHQARLVVVPVRNLTRHPGLTPEAEITTTDLLEHILRSFPQVKVVQDRDPGDDRPRTAVAGGDDTALIRRLVARTGADLVMLGELAPVPGSGVTVLRLKLLDRKGRLRASRESTASTAEFEPNLAVPSVLKELNRTLSPLGRSPEFPSMPPKEALEAYGTGLDLLRRGDTVRALPFLERAALLAPRFAPGVRAYGSALYGRGDPKALPTLMWAVATARESRDRYSEAAGLIGLALLARRTDRKSDEEVPLLEQALDLGRATGDTDLQAQTLNELGTHWIHKEDWAAAERSLSPALEMVTATGNRRLRTHILVNLGNRAKYLGQTQDARAFYLDAFADASVTESPLYKALTQNNLAILDLDEGRPWPAEKTFLEVLRLRRDLGDAEGECRTLLLLGIAAHMKGDFDQAAARYEAVLEASRKRDFLLIQGRALYRLGDLLRVRGRLAAATVRLMEASALLVKKGTAQNQADTLAALAECKARQRDLTEAGRLLDEARGLAGDRPQIWRAQAWVLHLRGRDKEALDALASALASPRGEDPEHREEVLSLASAWRKRS